MEFCKENFCHVTGAHHGHNLELEIINDTTAEGTWALYSYGIDTDVDKGLRWLGYYFDEYTRVEGEWKIRSTTLAQLLREIWDRNQTDEMPQER